VSDPLATYLHDHLAGSAHAIDLLKAIRDRQARTELGRIAAHLLHEIEADRETLRRIADSVGAGTSALKEIGAWGGGKNQQAETARSRRKRSRPVRSA
jgi:hypothetical protein